MKITTQSHLTQTQRKHIKKAYEFIKTQSDDIQAQFFNGDIFVKPANSRMRVFFNCVAMQELKDAWMPCKGYHTTKTFYTVS
jgi:hypothetical protein